MLILALEGKKSSDVTMELISQVETKQSMQKDGGNPCESGTSKGQIPTRLEEHYLDSTTVGEPCTVPTSFTLTDLNNGDATYSGLIQEIKLHGIKSRKSIESMSAA